MSQSLRIGMIGLDTSHVVAFAKLLNDTAHEHHVPGGRVTVAFPGGSPDFELSINRVEGFTKELRDNLGVHMVSSPEAVAEACDLLFIMSVDGRVHRSQFEQTVRFQRPTFIDKPFATSSADAKAIVELAKTKGVPVMSSSSLRYAENLVEALKARKDALVGIDAFGPMALQPTQPGLFWYGIHSVEVVVAALGTGCKELHATTNKDFDMITAEWSDGRMATIRGSRRGHGTFGAVIHDDKGPAYLDLSGGKRPYYAGLLDAIIRTLPKGQSDVPTAEMLEVVHFIEAANESRKTGHTVKL